MKKSILISAISCLLLTFSFSSAFCQVKPSDTTKAIKKPAEIAKPPAYKPDFTKPFEITLKANGTQFDQLNQLIGAGISLIDSSNYDNKTRNYIKAYGISVIKKIQIDGRAYFDADKARFVADSIKAASIKSTNKSKP